MTKKRRPLVAVIAATLVTTAVVARASDRIAVYAKVDRVVLEPNPDAPNAIQIWGVFSIAKADNPNDYHPATAGYLYYTLGGSADAARREWSDLKKIAGTGEIVAFGARRAGVPHLRQASEPPARPDAYAVNTGVIKMRGDTPYAPIRALRDFSR